MTKRVVKENKKNGKEKQPDRKKKIVKNKIKEKNNKQKVIDLALICDCTASMQIWMNRSKDTLKNIIENVRNEF